MENKNDEKFLIDSNAFITPFKNYYQFIFAPTFWKQLNIFCSNGKVITLDKVNQEICREKIEAKKDEIQLWLENSFSGEIVCTSDQEIVNNYAAVMNHLHNSAKYSEKAFDEWSDIKVADPWLIATAKYHGYTIVTFESKLNPQLNTPLSRAKIPNLCEDFNVKYCNLFQMMALLGFKL